MIIESRKKIMKKFIQMNCLTAMEEYSIETARAFIYMFENNGWNLGSVGNQDFIDYFREKKSFTDKDESKWFDIRNVIEPEWEKAKYKGLRLRLKIRMQVYGSKLKIDSISTGGQSLDKVKPINLNQSIKKAFGKVVSIANEMGDILIDAKAKGKSRWSVDVKDQIKDKYKSNKEQIIKKKLEPLQEYFTKTGYEMGISKQYDIYQITFRPTEFDNIDGINHGVYFPHQYLNYIKKLPLIIKKANQAGLWLDSYGSNTERREWLEFRLASPDKVAPDHYGKDPESGKRRSRKKGKENLKYDTNRKSQQQMIHRIIKFSEKMAKDEDVIKRCREAIKYVCVHGQEEE